MATIYRFIVESKSAGGGDGRKSSKDKSGISKGTTAKKGRYVSILGGKKGGVEHNRKMRAFNPMLNKITHGYAEKGIRLGRAGLGLVTRNTETGKLGLSGPAVAIIIQMIIMAVLKVQSRDREKADKLNAQNWQQMENGVGTIHGAYDISVNTWSGRRTYNENK